MESLPRLWGVLRPESAAFISAETFHIYASRSIRASSQTRPEDRHLRLNIPPSHPGPPDWKPRLPVTGHLPDSWSICMRFSTERLSSSIFNDTSSPRAFYQPTCNINHKTIQPSVATESDLTTTTKQHFASRPTIVLVYAPT